MARVEPFDPLKSYNNGLDDLHGLVHVDGSNNTVTGNHFSYDVPSGSVSPSNQPPRIVLVASGSNNFIATNNTVPSVTVRTVVLDAATSGTKVLDSGTPAQFEAHGSPHSFRATRKSSALCRSTL